MLCSITPPLPTVLNPPTLTSNGSCQQQQQHTIVIVVVVVVVVVSFTICTPDKIDQSKNEMGGARSTYGEQDRHIQGFGGDT